MTTVQSNLTHSLPDAASGAAPSTTPSGTAKDRQSRRARRRGWLQAGRRAALAAFALAAVAMGFYAFRPRPVPVDLSPVTRGPLVVEVRESGRTRVHDRYEVSAPVTGRLMRIDLEPNDAVSEGQPLLAIAPLEANLLDERTLAQSEARLSVARSALERAKAQQAQASTALASAKRELSRATSLEAAGVGTPQAAEQLRFEVQLRRQEVSSARFATKVAAEEVRLAQAALEGPGKTTTSTAAPQNRAAHEENYEPGSISRAEPAARGPSQGRGPSQRALLGSALSVRAPVSGHVLRVHRESAGVVSAGTPLLELGDLAGLEVVADLLTTDAVRIEPGTPVAIEGWGGERSLSGRVRKVELGGFTRLSALGVEEQRTNVIVELTEPRDHWTELGDNYRVEVRVVLWSAEDVVKVARGAVFRHGDSWASFVVDGDTARRVPVVVGHLGEAEVEVVSGLDPGDTVVVAPGDRVEEGVRVEPR